MKIHKFSIIAALALVGLLACASFVSAQDAKEGKKKGPSIEQQMDRLSTQLNLTDDQKPKVKAVLEDRAAKGREIRSDSSLSQDQRREKMRTLMQDENKKMKEILTTEQYDKYEKAMAERRNRRGGPEGKAPEKKSE